MAAPPSSSSSPNRASLDNLPTELLKHVVGHAAKDRQSTYATLSKGGSQRDKLQLLASCDPRWTVVATHWSAAYGREIESLSKVNKRLRRLTMPLILDRVLQAARQSNRSLTHPRHDLSSVPKDTSYIDVAQIFPLLPAVDTLSVDAESIALLFKVTPRKALVGHYADAMSAFSLLGRRIRRLAVKNVAMGELPGDVLPRLSDASQLRHFAFSGHLEGIWHEETTMNQEFRTFLVSLTALESLEIEELRIDDPEDGLTMPVTPQWPNIVPLFAKAMPRIKDVSMRFRSPFYEAVNLAQYLARVPSIRWPALESFAFEGHVNLTPALLPAFETCSALRRLDLSPGQPDFAVLDHVWHILPGTAPANVRHITFRPYNADAIPLPLRAACESWCEARRITFSWRYRQSSFGDVDDEFFWRNRSDNNQSTIRSSALADVLVWASNRLQHLQATNADGDGLDEMVKLLRPLRERRHIERGTPEQDS